MKKEELKEVKEEKQTTKKDEDDLFCYIGPNLPGGALKKNAILAGTKEQIKEKFAEQLEQFPQLMQLIVKIEDIADAKAKMKQKGTILNKNYSDIISQANAEKNK